jgi:hypothetical protein
MNYNSLSLFLIPVFHRSQRHVSSIVQQSQSLFKLPESKEKIKFTNFCMDLLDRYEHCTHQYNTDLENLDFRLMKLSAQDLEQYHRTLSIEERATSTLGLSFDMRDELDPNWKERLDMEIPED